MSSVPEKQTVQLLYACAVVKCWVQSWDFWEAAFESQGIYICNRIKATKVGKFCFPLDLYTSTIANAFSADVHKFNDHNKKSVMQIHVFHISLVKLKQSIDFSSHNLHYLYSLYAA